MFGVGGNSGLVDGRGRCELLVDGEVEVVLDVGGGVGGTIRDGMKSLGRGKKRFIPSGRSDAVSDLPYDLGVRMYDQDGGCHV